MASRNPAPGPSRGSARRERLVGSSNDTQLAGRICAGSPPKTAQFATAGSRDALDGGALALFPSHARRRLHVVPSELACLRIRPCDVAAVLALERELAVSHAPVSYTHLTLPTICSV